MLKSQMMEEAREYVGDILNWLEKEDYSSAQRMVSALRKAISIWRKNIK